MLFPEEKKVYKTKIGDANYTVTSESLPDTQQDMLDSLTRLMVRDCGSVYDQTATTTRIPTKEEMNFLQDLWDRLHDSIEWDVKKDEEK